ncbi:tail fiber repeat 2-containing protein [Yersinia thracica]|uniref:Tail fiber repeat 2-containing protein n=1 Tax=Yersinia thracica TaxID=2890319 RepID=A0A0T9P481_9GAMM|nr:tail fiber protein [Yersinia thracica]CNH43199.1 tail fiber repeat 2-containing protein [Yersinia thracica]
MESAIKSYANSNLPSASLTQKGVVQLSSSTNSTSETLAATPKAVKAALDASLPVGGTAKAAEKLATSRKISGVDFDGTKDITLPFINTTDTNVQLAGTLTEQGHIISQGNLISKTNIGADGRCDITGDLRGGRVLSKSDVIVGEGQAGGYATISSTGNIIGAQWGGSWLSTRTARAFAVFNAKTGAVSGSVGISSVVRNAAGTYTVVFSSAMPGAYAVVVGVDGAYNTHEPTVTSKAATSFRILTPADGGVDYGLQDQNEIQFVVFSVGT